jgi:hypothetical protein
MQIRAYTLAVNFNHAPHVGGRLLTLANCKAGIRRVARRDEWIAGVTPKRMGYRLAYLMRVGDSWTRARYWQKFKRGREDSIYQPTTGGRFRLLKNPFHDASNYDTDTECNRVLWSHEFYYFAEPYDRDDTDPHGLILDTKYSKLCRSMRTRYGFLIDVPDDFVEWVKRQPGRLKDIKTLYPEIPHPCGNCQSKRGSE